MTVGVGTPGVGLTLDACGGGASRTGQGTAERGGPSSDDHARVLHTVGAAHLRWDPDPGYSGGLRSGREGSEGTPDPASQSLWWPAGERRPHRPVIPEACPSLSAKCHHPLFAQGEKYASISIDPSESMLLKNLTHIWLKSQSKRVMSLHGASIRAPARPTCRSRRPPRSWPGRAACLMASPRPHPPHEVLPRVFERIDKVPSLPPPPVTHPR